MKFGVVIFPSKRLQDIANSYRKRYDPHYSLITPHLTLKNAFEATEDEVVNIADKLRQIAGKTNALDAAAHLGQAPRRQHQKEQNPRFEKTHRLSICTSEREG